MPRGAKRRRTEHPSSDESNPENATKEKAHDTESRSIFEEHDIGRMDRLLEPGPVVLVTTSHNGEANVMTMGFHMVMQHEDPPLLGVVIGPWDHSFKALKATGECVLAIPGADLADIVVEIGNTSGEDEDKFAKHSLTQIPAAEVGSPLIKECLANVECRVKDRSNVRKYNLWILEVVRAWTNPSRDERRTMHHKGKGMFTLDGDEIDLSKKMTKWEDLP